MDGVHRRTRKERRTCNSSNGARAAAACVAQCDVATKEGRGRNKGGWAGSVVTRESSNDSCFVQNEIIKVRVSSEVN